MKPVAKPYIPALEHYQRYLSRAFDSGCLTNNGPLNRELTDRLKGYLGVENLLLVGNGTLALQIAQQALGVTGNAVTTAFTFAATAGAIKWQGTELRFAEIDGDSFNLNPAAAAAAVDAKTGAIVPVHVYGNPCDVEEFEQLSKQAQVPIVYDAAHAFGVTLNGESVLNYGDASTLSLHATKLFHSGEGGAIVFRKKEHLEQAAKLINFGIDTQIAKPVMPGINAKMSELHAAMGLAVLDCMPSILEHRLDIQQLYQARLAGAVKRPRWHAAASQNGAYVPIVLESDASRTALIAALKTLGYEARSYFSPSLDTVPGYANSRQLPVSQAASQRLLCLPIHYEVERNDVEVICETVKRVVGQ